MRKVIGRTAVGLVLAAATLLAASGCGAQLPPGADGNLVNQWPAMAEPQIWQPEEGACANRFTAASYRSSYDPVSCDKTHSYETVAVVEFAGAAAERSTPPTEGSPDMRAAWADCAKRSTTHLGGPWSSGAVWIGVSVPSAAAWTGGARWYRCELAALDGRYGDAAARTGSLKGEFAGASPLEFGCYQYTKRLAAIACNKTHNAEFVGVWDAGNTPFTSLNSMRNKIITKCRSLVAKYVKVPDDGQMRYRTGLIWDWPSREDWDAGNHHVSCHLWLDKRKLTKSLKGGGTKVLPLN
ncbi:septum formation family protein [Catellatospora sp. NPDC049609]|uniref:septum formation family protein n=1 Tax=Catellatospora sp. NPDC049609 TaxID=3155505 RepID=UPI0034423681